MDPLGAEFAMAMANAKDAVRYADHAAGQACKPKVKKGRRSKAAETKGSCRKLRGL